MKITLDQAFVNCYSKKFEESKYPYLLYKKIVWDRIELNNKYSILGAWKTGCVNLKIGKGYKSFEFEDCTYYYTRRWKKGTPAQKCAWEELNSSSFQHKLLQVAEQDKCEESEIFREINAIDGIGFVYAMFVMHCEIPKVFPLYDQHVWRAFLYFTNQKYESAKVASSSWNSFEHYSKWFKNQLKTLVISDPTELDRALWVFGKEIKKK